MHIQDGTALGKPHSPGIFFGYPVEVHFGNHFSIRSSSRRDPFQDFSDLQLARENFSSSYCTILEQVAQGKCLELNNVGVSILPILNWENERYLVLVSAKSCQAEQPLFKAVSGYCNQYDFLDSNFPATILRTAAKELQEELLFLTENQHALGCGFGTMVFNDLVINPALPAPRLVGWTAHGKPLFEQSAQISGESWADFLHNPWSEDWNEQGTPYLNSIVYELNSKWTARAEPVSLNLPSFYPSESVRLGDLQLNAKAYIDGLHGSAQIVFQANLVVSAQQYDQLSLHHVEEIPLLGQSGRVLLQPVVKQALLIRLDGNMMTRDNFFLQDGKLIRAYDCNDLRLSELFSPAQQLDGRSTGIVTDQSITLAKFLSGYAARSM